MKGIRKISALSLVLVLFLSGCEKSQEIPTLIEPVVNNQSYRPVEYGEVGRREVKMADVVPEEYCHFTKNATEILEIKVDLGQYVEQGEVLATIDVTEFENEIDNKSAEVNLKNKVTQAMKKIYREQIKELNLEKEVCILKGDDKGRKECETQIAIVEENRRYDEMLCKHQVTMLQEEIAESKEDVENGTIRARHAGYVTYVKDMSETNVVESMENIVIVSDYDSLHLELSDNLLSEFYSRDMQVLSRIYTSIGGKEYAVEPYEYTNAEMLAIQRTDSYPRIRLELKNQSGNIQPGEKIPVYFVSDQKENVLKIGKDSLYNEGDKYFVYVKNGEEKEKKEIQIGAVTDTEVEVISGLQEGEWVFYSSNAIMPDQYNEYTVKKKVFSPEGGEVGLKSQYVYTKLYAYTQQDAATVESLNFSAGDTVKKGDLICVLDTETSTVRLKEMQNNISNLKADYEKSKKSYDKQIENLKKEIKKKKKEQSAETGSVMTAGKAVSKSTADKMSAYGVDGIATVGNVNPESERETAAGENDNKEPENEVAAGENANKEPEEGAASEESSGKEPEKVDTKGESDNKETEKETETGESGNEQTESQLTTEENSNSETANTIAHLECQQNILVYEREILKIQYEYDYSLLQKEYNEAAKKNNGHGKVEIYAAQNGILGNVSIYKGMQIEPDKNDRLFQIFDETSRKLIIDTKDDFVGVGNKVSFDLLQDNSKTYTGEVVGNSAAAQKVYLSKVNGKIYVTKSLSDSEKNKAYIAVKDSEFNDGNIDVETFYSKVQTQDVETSYSRVRIQNVVVLPSSMVNEEVNKWQPNVTYYYVWKIVDGVLVKQYVKTDETLNTIADTCILEGLQDGDVVAGLNTDKE